MHPSACGFTGGEITLALGLTATIAFLAGAGLMHLFYTAPPKAGE